MKIGLVTVHGFISSPAVWQSLCNAMEADHELADVVPIHFKYSSPKNFFRFRTRIPSLVELGDLLATFYQQELEEYEQVFFVAHSQGGLVVQAFLERLISKRQANELAKIRHIVMFACPNLGSPFLLSHRRAIMRRNHIQEVGLRPLDPYASNAHRTTIERVVNARTTTETACPISFSIYYGERDAIVPKETALGMFPETLGGALPGDHNSIIQIEDHKSRTYVAIKFHLRQYIKDALDSENSTETPAQMRPRLFGRQDAISKLSAILGGPDSFRRAIISGMPGIGKTTLCEAVIETAEARAYDAIIKIDCKAYDPFERPMNAGAIARHALRRLGFNASSETEDDLLELLRIRMSKKNILLVLDNIANAEVVRKFLPGITSALLVTSRNELSGLVGVDGFNRIALRELDPNTPSLTVDSDSASLLIAMIGKERCAGQESILTAVAECCNRIPLTLRLAGERMANDPQSLADQLGQLRLRRSEYLSDATDPRASLRDVLEWSIDSLDSDARTLFILQALHFNSILNPYSVAALMEVDVFHASEMLERLAKANLLRRSPNGTYHSYDLLRDAASRYLDEIHNKAEIVERVLKWYLCASQAAISVLGPGRPLPESNIISALPMNFADYNEALKWCDIEVEGIGNAIQHAYSGGQLDITWMLAATMTRYLDIRGRVDDWVEYQETGLQAAVNLNNVDAERWILNTLGIAYKKTGRANEAVHNYDRALEIAKLQQDSRSEALALGNLGNLHRDLGNFDTAIQCYDEAGKLFSSLGLDKYAADVMCNNAALLADIGDAKGSIQLSEHALKAAKSVGDETGQALSLANICHARVILGDSRGAIDAGVAARLILSSKEDTTLGMVQLDLGDAYQLAGYSTIANTCWQDAQRILQGMHDPRAQLAVDRLRQCE